MTSRFRKIFTSTAASTELILLGKHDKYYIAVLVCR